MSDIWSDANAEWEAWETAEEVIAAAHEEALAEFEDHDPRLDWIYDWERSLFTDAEAELAQRRYEKWLERRQ